tara:strand:- start:4738 stop:5166 length:429 start_codon:yes stop_codon:yes gene_type:complete
MAQVRTGGGGVFDPEELGFVKTYDLSLSAPSPIDSEMRQYVQQLVDQEKSCVSSDRSYLSSNKEFDLYQAYLTLSFVKASKCDYVKCLNSKATQDAFKQLKKTDGLIKHLEKRYDIDEGQAHNILKFFKNLSKGCKKAQCEM